MSDLHSYKLGSIAQHLISTDERVYLHWLGDSQSTPTSTPRWARGINREWSVDWRQRILYLAGSGLISVSVEGWSSFAQLDSEVAVGATLSDGVTVVPNGLVAGEEWFATDGSNFVPFYRMNTSGYADAASGAWLEDQPIRFTLAMLKLDTGANMTQFRARCRVNGADAGNTQTINLESTLAASSDWQALDIDFDAESVTSSAELYIDNGGVDDTGTGCVIGAIAVGIQDKTTGFALSFDAAGGWQTTDHIPTSDGGERTDITPTALANKFGVYEWPTVIAIQLGQNSAAGEDATPSGLATYKANILKIIDNYNAAYDAAGESRPHYMLVGNWETSKGNAFWDGATDQLKDICDERSNTGLLNLFAIVNDTYGTFATWNGTYLADQIHQNATGADAFASLAWSEIIDASSIATSIPDPTYELRSDQDIVRSGSAVTSWGNASGGTSPTYSNAEADRILGFPVVKFDSASTQHLEWDEIASVFSGDDPDLTVAGVIRPGSLAAIRAWLGVGGSGTEWHFFGLSASDGAYQSRNDGSSTANDGFSVMTEGVAYLVMHKVESGVGSTLIRRLDTGAELSSSSSMNVASTTMSEGAIGYLRRGASDRYAWEGDIARIRIYDSALKGDLTGYLSGTQLGKLKNEMLTSIAEPANPAIVKTTLSASAVDAVLSDFPMPITNTGLGASMSSLLVGNDRGAGDDLWGNSTGLTNAQTGHKVGYWDNSGSKFLAYAKLASASNLTDTDSFTHVGGNPGASDPFRSTDEMILPLIGDFNDVTSNGNDGTAENGLTAGGATGPDGSLPATSFDGVSEYVELTNGTSIIPDTGTGVDESATVMGWFFDAAHKASEETLINIGGATNGLLVHLENGSIYGVAAQSGTVYVVSSAYTANQWNHFAFVADDGNDVRLYLNGSLVDTTAFTTVGNWGTDLGGVGATGGAGAKNQDGLNSPGAGGQPFEGDLCLFSAASTDLSAAEIKANYLLTGPNAATYLSAVEVPENTNTNLRDFLLGYDPLIYVRGYLGGNLGSAGTISTQGTPTEGGKLVRKDLQSSMSLTATEGYRVTNSGLCSAMAGKTWGVAVFQTTSTAHTVIAGGREESGGDLRWSLELNRNSAGTTGVAGTVRVEVTDNSGTLKSLIAGVDTDMGFTDGETHTLIWTMEPSTNTVEVWCDGVSQTVAYNSQDTPDTFDVANWTNGFGVGYFQRDVSSALGLTGELQEVAVGTGDAPDASALQDLVDGIQASYDQTLSDLTPTYAWALDEAFGTTAYNWIGAANNGTISGNVQLDQSPLIRSGRSMLFNSGGDSGNITTATGLDTTNAWSIGVWATTSASSGVDDLIVQQAGTGTAEALMRRTGDGFIQSVFGGSGATGSITVNDGSPHFIVQTFSGGAGGTLTQYVDGVLDFSTTRTSQAATGSLVFGSSEVSSRWFTGTIDEVAFWEGTALTAEQVTELYTAGSDQLRRILRPGLGLRLFRR